MNISAEILGVAGAVLLVVAAALIALPLGLGLLGLILFGAGYLLTDEAEATPKKAAPTPERENYALRPRLPFQPLTSREQAEMNRDLDFAAKPHRLPRQPKAPKPKLSREEILKHVNPGQLRPARAEEAPHDAMDLLA